MRIDVITIFPAMFSPVLNESIIQRAQDAGLLDIRVHDLRAYTHDKRRTVDDRPYGGGPGMVMKPEPLFEAVEAIRPQASAGCTILMSPQGERLTPVLAKKLASMQRLIVVCGRYEGVDDRVREGLADRSVSIGDYVLTGGELPAMVLIDCVARYIGGVIGNEKATEEESFSNGWLEYPQYTRPPEYRGMKVPEVLLSGSHEEIAKWRHKQAVARTQAARPDLVQPKGEEPWTG